MLPIFKKLPNTSGYIFTVKKNTDNIFDMFGGIKVNMSGTEVSGCGKFVCLPSMSINYEQLSTEESSLSVKGDQYLEIDKDKTDMDDYTFENNVLTITGKSQNWRGYHFVVFNVETCLVTPNEFKGIIIDMGPLQRNSSGNLPFVNINYDPDCTKLDCNHVGYCIGDSV